MLFGLAVFLFFFGLLPYWFKLHKHLREILGCECRDLRGASDRPFSLILIFRARLIIIRLGTHLPERYVLLNMSPIPRDPAKLQCD